MARSVIDPQDTSHSGGLQVAFESANSDGNAVVNNGHRVLLVNNTDTADKTVTQVTGGTVAGIDVADPDVTAAAGEITVLGPWPQVYNQDDGDEVHLDYDDTTGLEVAVVEITRV